MSAIVNEFLELSQSQFEVGSIGSSGNTSSTKRLRTINRFSIPNGTKYISLDISTRYTLYVNLLGYENDTTDTPLFDLYWYSNGTSFDVSSCSNLSYIRIVIKGSSDSEMEVSDINGVTIYFEGIRWAITDEGLVCCNAPKLPELMQTSAPDAMWRPIDKTIETETSIEVKAELEHLKYPQLSELMKTSAPIGMWRIDKTNTLTNGIDSMQLGAFCFATSFNSISIPTSCKSIGPNSFTNTQLTEINLPDECTYYSTSFPEGCVVKNGILIE